MAAQILLANNDSPEPKTFNKSSINFQHNLQSNMLESRRVAQWDKSNEDSSAVCEGIAFRIRRFLVQTLLCTWPG